MKIVSNSAQAEISFCDDDEECLKRTAKLLERCTNYDVEEFHVTENFRNDEFMEHFYEKDFDMTILDLKMPVNWYAIFISIRKKDPEHPIVIFTAHKEDFEVEMVEHHVNEVEDPLLKIIRKSGGIRSKDELIPSVERFAKISMIRKLDRHKSLMIKDCNEDIDLRDKLITFLDHVPDKINHYAKIIEEVPAHKHTTDQIIDDLKIYLYSKDVWEYFKEKETGERLSLLFLLKKFLISISSSDLTNDDLDLICNTLYALHPASDNEILNNIINDLRRLMSLKGVSIIPPIKNIDSLLKSYDDELLEEV